MNSMILLETERLGIRQLRDDDFKVIFRIQSDPELMRYIRPAEMDPVVVRARMAHWQQYQEQQPGLGVFALELRETGVFAGYCVARHVDFEAGRDLEAGYLILPEFAGQGLATEVTKALVDYLFQRKAAPKVVAFTDPENAASQRVLEKCGFQRKDLVQIYGGDSVLFEIYR